MNQTYQNWELILIDDGSSDKTLSIAKTFKDPRIHVIADGLNKNLPSRLNQAIDISQGKYFARMDGDDISYPERLESQVEYLENHPEIDLLATHVLVFGKDGCARGVYTANEYHVDICCRPWSGFGVIHPTWMGKIEWFRTYPYQPQAIRMEDFEILLRTYQNSRFHCLPKILFGYRVESISLQKSLSSRYYLSRTLIKTGWQSKNWMFTYGALEQVAKAVVDIFAVSTGLSFTILRHRSGSPASSLELQQWEEVWRKCNSREGIELEAYSS